MPTGIEYVDETINLWVGCRKMSPGCGHCFAERAVDHGRLKHLYPRGFGSIHYRPRRLLKVFNWRKPKRIFINDLSDFYDPRVRDALRVWAFGVMEGAHCHTFLNFTKRTEEMLAFQRRYYPGGLPDNVMPIMSVENQEWLERRMEHFAQVNARLRGVSLEPLLGPVDLTPWLRARKGADYEEGWEMEEAWIERPVLQWVIVGGESGPNARPCHPDWIRSIRDQCQEAGVPFFFKQWGEWAPTTAFTDFHDQMWAGRQRGLRFNNGEWVYRVGRKAAGALLDGKEHREWPLRERPE
ncbi:MAG: DUF5131 family protein [Chloroflexota bacterium]